MTTIYLINNALTMNNLAFPETESLISKREKRILSIEGEEESKNIAKLEYLQKVGEKFCKYYNFNELENNSEDIIRKNIKELNKKIERLNNVLNSHKKTIDNLYIDKLNGLVDEEMYKRIYEKTKTEISKLNLEVEELKKKKQINEKQVSNDPSFNKCKKSIIDYMSLKNPTKDQVKRLIDRIEIDKDKKIYVHLRFPELNEQL